MDNPSVGRIVHVLVSGTCYPAIVTEVVKDSPRWEVWLTIFLPRGLPGFTDVPVPYDSGVVRDDPYSIEYSKTNHWHWPERV